MHPDYTVLDITPSGTGDTLTVLYELAFADSFPEGQMQMYAMARNWPNMFSGGDNPGCAVTEPCRTTEPGWTWGFDFGAPSPVSVSAQHIGTDDPNTMRFDQEAADGSPNDSGLRSIFDRTYWIDREGEGHIPPGSSFLIGNPINFSTYTTSWSTQSAPIPGFEGGDVVHANISAMDMACNISANSYESDQIGHEWIQTRGGDVYTGGTYFDPIQIEGDALSMYWLGGAGTASCASGNFGSGIGSDQSPWWCSNDYTDGNLRSIRGNWYDTLYRLALGSDWLEQNQGGEILTVSSLNFASATDGVYEYSGEGLLVTGVCRGRKLVFIPNSQAAVDVTVRPDFRTNQSDAACMIVAEHGSVIQIVGGASAPGDIDYVDAAFITDGTFQVLKDDVPPVYDRLVIDGFVFSDTSDFLRDLVFADNLEYAAETIEYDPRYLMLLKEMVGRRPIRDFECGIVKGSSMCDGWWGE